MEAKITTRQNKEKDFQYPCLLINKDEHGDLVILAYEDSHFGCFAGTLILNTTQEPYLIGEYSDNWIKIDFELFKGTITLES